MVIGISVDIDQVNECYELILQNIDIIGHIQFYLDDTPFDNQKRLIRKIQNLLSEYKITYSLHSYGYINLCESIEEVRRSWINIACKTIELAKETSSVFVNYHMGYTFSSSYFREDLMNNLCESLKVLSKYAIDASVYVNVENDFDTSEIKRLGSQIGDLDTIIKCGYPNVKLCYDVGHANIAFSSPYEYRNYLNFIQSFHIHNNWKVSDSHIAYGMNGSINLKNIFAELLNYNDIFFILENDINKYSIALKNIKASLQKPI